MSGVNVTIDVNFDSGVHSDNADTTSNFRAVSNFLRTEDDVFFVGFYVFIEFFEAFRRRAQSGTGANTEFASIELAYMKSELLVIADQHAAVNTFPGLVHTARHTMGVGNTRSQQPNPQGRELSKVGLMTGVKS